MPRHMVEVDVGFEVAVSYHSCFESCICFNHPNHLSRVCSNLSVAATDNNNMRTAPIAGFLYVSY